MQEPSHLTLSQAARVVPSSVSPNCVWRWCRRGVLARTGERIKLQHVRIGGKLFTKAKWIEEFGERLAEADARYFDLADKPDDCTNFVPPPRRRRVTHSAILDNRRRKHLAQVRRELEDAGL